MFRGASGGWPAEPGELGGRWRSRTHFSMQGWHDVCPTGDRTNHGRGIVSERDRRSDSTSEESLASRDIPRGTDEHADDAAGTRQERGDTQRAKPARDEAHSPEPRTPEE